MFKPIFERRHVVWRVCAELALGGVSCVHRWTSWDIVKEEDFALFCADVEDRAGAFVVVSLFFKKK